MEISRDELRAIIREAVTPNLDNGIAKDLCEESEDIMALNSCKIRRSVTINGVKIWIAANTEQEYAEKLLALASAKAPEPKTHPEKHNFEKYALHWFETFSKPNVSYVTAQNYARHLRKKILPILGPMNIEDITPEDVQSVFNHMPKDAKQESKHKVKIIMNQIFNMAVDDGLIMRNPLQSSHVKVKGTAPTVTQPYTVEQMQFLAAHLKDLSSPYDRAWLAIIISLPLRPEEVLGLRWEDVDTENCIFHIRNTVIHPERNTPEFKPYTKTQASVRDLSFTPTLLKYLPPRGDPKAFVVSGENPMTYTQVQRMRKRIKREINFDENITPRRFRTTVATDISAQTHDLKLVQHMLGHSTPQMTLKHYDKGRSISLDATNAIQACYGLE